MFIHLFRTEPGVFPSRFPTVFISLYISPTGALVRPYSADHSGVPPSPSASSQIPKKKTQKFQRGLLLSWAQPSWWVEVGNASSQHTILLSQVALVWPGGAGAPWRSWGGAAWQRQDVGRSILPHLPWRRSINRNIFIEGTGTRHRAMSTGARWSGKGALFWACFAGWLVPYLPTGWLWSCPCQLPYQQNGPQIPIHRVILS